MMNNDKGKGPILDGFGDLQLKIIDLDLAKNITISQLSISNILYSNNTDICFSSQPREGPSSFSDLIDIELLQRFSTTFYAATGLPHTVLDPNNNVLAGIGSQDICLRFHRVCPQTASRCQNSTEYINALLHDGPYVACRCLNGLMEYAAPITAEGQHLATLFVGQFLHQPADEDLFRDKARSYGFNESDYLEALRRVPIITEEKIKHIMHFYKQLSRFLTTLGMNRKRQAQAVSRSEQKFSKIFNCNPDLISISTVKEGRYVDVNDAFVEITGYEREEVIGRTVAELNIWLVPEQRAIILQQARETGSARNIEVKFRMKSGLIRNFITSFEIMDIEGEEHLIVTTKDITERIRMEEELRLSEECFSKAFNASPVSMTISTLEEGIFIQTNDAYCKTLGYSREEALCRSSYELGIWSDLADRDLVKNRILAGQSVKDMEIRFRNKNGEQRLGSLCAEGIDIHGQLCILSTLSDITDIRKIEVEMTRLDRLNLVGEMAASIGHEIRNPLTAVRGYLQLLMQSEPCGQQTDYFDLMIEELDRANSIITEFLSVAKDKVVDVTLDNLNTIINRSLPLIQATAIARDQYVKLELADLPDLLLDKNGISQLIINLVNNGLEAMSSTGWITIRTCVENDLVVLAVQDEGCGIEHNLLDMLGRPFFTTKEQGTGLGLAVCYRIASQHNAVIDLDTSPKGTTFYVRFPCDSKIQAKPRLL